MDITDLVYIDAAGYHYSDFPTFQAWLIAQYQSIYGSDVYLGDDSQDGQFLAILAQAFYDVAAQGNSNYNSFSPTTAQGVGLSNVVQINGLQRRIATYSTVQLTIVGQAGTVLTNAIAIDGLQQQWSIPTTTIPSGGTITVTGTSLAIGAIAALANTITGLYTPTQGWQSVNNATPATLGAPVETDAQLRARQAISTAIASQTVFDGTKAAVANVAGVTAVQGYENDTGTTDGNGIPAHSISIVANGGVDTAIAQAIQLTKTPGCGTYGTTSVVTYDSHGMPLTINFYYATDATIAAQVTLVPLVGWSTDYEVLIQNAVSAAILAVPIGGTVIITQLIIAAYLVGTPAYGTYTLSGIEISKNGGSLGSSNIALNFNEITVCDPSTNVTVVT
jgi:uncharacterized phage protein gp47/JayE